MTQKTRGGTTCSIMLAIAALVSTAVSEEGCNTEQSPKRQLSDAQITAQIKAKLASDVRASSIANIQVNTTNGVVTLAGQVEGENVKHSAETVAASVPGVVPVPVHAPAARGQQQSTSGSSSCVGRALTVTVPDATLLHRGNPQEERFGNSRSSGFTRYALSHLAETLKQVSPHSYSRKTWQRKRASND
jgi:BON domain